MSSSGWREGRTAQFDAWRRQASPDLERKLEKVRARTALLADQRKTERRDRWARDCAAHAEQSARLTEAERQRIVDQTAEASRLADAADWPSAERLYAAIVETDPANVDAQFGLGVCRRQQGDLTGASRRFSIAAAFPRVGMENGFFKSMLALQKLPAPRDPDLDRPMILFKIDGAPAEIWDAPDAPLMRVIPGGEYTMGSLESDPRHVADETPHRVTIGYPLAVGKYDVTRGEFAAFVEATGYDADYGAGCEVWRDGRLQMDPKGSWRDPGFPQTDDDPVVCVNWFDGVAYADWLTRTTGHRYRLPSEAEWEYAVRGGTSTDYHWGGELGLGHANCDGCTEGAPHMKPTRGDMFAPNPFGLHDVCGNVWKWMADAWNPSYVGAPCDGSAWDDGTTALRGRRGGSWFNISEPRPNDPRAPYRLRAAARFGSLPHLRMASFGLRVVREI